MVRLAGFWIFFSHNVGDAPLDFAVAGNLGSDGSGAVTEYTFHAAPYIGFVKDACGADDDPSVNYMVVVDAAAGRPTHNCDHADGRICDGASSDIDDDTVSGIAPGSPILYLLYSSEGNHCIKGDEHHAIFDAAVRCLWVEDPFEAVHQGFQDTWTQEQPLVEVAVDDRGHVVFGGWHHTQGGCMDPRHTVFPDPAAL